MPVSVRTFRVFVSSTFEDLKAERDALQREVFPKLRQLCEKHGARFQAIDLRWGVRDEAALDQKTMEICLREIERCQQSGIKPNFIVLLGQRYGWQPLPYRIEAQEFQALLNRMSSPGARALVERWYKCDENAVPAAYLLQPRTGEWVGAERWQECEARLRHILLDAAHTAQLTEDARVKYSASATHQEILKGLCATEEELRHIFTFCRRTGDETCDPGLAALKRYLGSRLPKEHVFPYEPDDFSALCQKVEQSLRAVIDSELVRFESRPALAIEREAHDAFARGRASMFGREEVLSEINRFLHSGGGTLLLQGASGSGKSAVMARASEQAISSLRSVLVIRRFLGATPASSHGLTLLCSLAEEIGESLLGAGQPPVELDGALRALRERLALATAARPIAIFIDALDQLDRDDPIRSLDWLNEPLPEHCHIVLSTADREQRTDTLEVLDLPALPQADAAAALDDWLHAAQRRLQPAQREYLMAAYARSGLPLFLKLAFEHARTWASYSPREEWELGESIEELICGMLQRLSLDSNHGSLMVGRSLGYLAAARYGLSEDEMLDLLSSDGEVWEDFDRRTHHAPPEHRLPAIVWSRLYIDLEPYLSERAGPGGALMGFFHRQLAEQAAKRFLAGGQKVQRHEHLSRYFLACADPESNGMWNGASPHAFAELPFQLGGAEVWRLLEETLADPVFCEAKIGATDAYDLRSDCRRALRLRPSGAIAATELAVTGALGVLVEDPAHTLQTLVNRLAWMAREEPLVQRGLERAMRHLDQRGPWLCADSPYPRMNAELDILPFQLEAKAVCLSSDGRAIVVASEDGRVRTIDLRHGSTHDMHTVPAAEGGILSIQETYPGGPIAWLEATGTLRVERSPHVIHLSDGESKFACLPRLGTVAMDSEGNLVAQSVSDGARRVLCEGLPRPLSLLKAHGALLLCVAGRTNQRILVFAATHQELELRLDLAWSQAPIADADIDLAGETVLLLCRDRSLRCLAVDGGQALGDAFRYEQGGPDAIWGAPLFCAMGSDGWAFVATRDLQIGAWNRDASQLCRLPDWRSEQQREIALFACEPESGRLVLGLQNEARILTHGSRRREQRFHQSPVDACLICESGACVSMSKYDGAVCWFAEDAGLNLTARQYHSGLSAIAPVPQSNDVLLGSEKGRCWRQRSDRSAQSRRSGVSSIVRLPR